MERRGGCGSGIDVLMDEVRDSGRGDVVDEGESWEEEDRCRGCSRRVIVVVIGEGHVGGGQHEFLDFPLARDLLASMDAEDVHARAQLHTLSQPPSHYPSHPAHLAPNPSCPLQPAYANPIH